MSITVSREQLDRLNRAGPRYTSYPTVPVWSTDFEAEDYRRALAKMTAGTATQQDGLSLYLHLPYCVNRCHYCGCNAERAHDRHQNDAYIDHLEQEINLIGSIIGRQRVSQMHWGGGTPNFLAAAQLERLMEILHRHFDFISDGEYSLEADPRVGSDTQAKLLADLGFNRISLGVQDFEHDVQVAIGRRQSREKTVTFFHACRDAGFTSVNLDLVYGLPGQTPESFEATLAAVGDLCPDRIACFGYAHVPWVRPNQKSIDPKSIPDPYTKFSLFQQTVNTLTAGDYRWIGLDHFARADDELSLALEQRRLYRNFMGYTTRPGRDLLALGMSGISDIAGCFVQNQADLAKYLATIDQQQLPVVRGMKLSADDKLRQLVILSLMCNLELDFTATVATFGATVDQLLGKEIEQLEPLINEGLAELEPGRLKITGLGRYFVRNVCMVFDAYFDPHAQKPLFSRTV